MTAVTEMDWNRTENALWKVRKDGVAGEAQRRTAAQQMVGATNKFSFLYTRAFSYVLMRSYHYLHRHSLYTSYVST